MKSMKIDLNKIKAKLKKEGFFSFTPLEKYPEYPATSCRTKISSRQKQDSTFLPSFLTGFIKKIEKTEPRAEIYLVGGAVRDLIINRQTTDFDFIVRNVPAKKLENILAKLGKVNFVGKTFGVFKLTLKDNPYDIDIALPRTDYAFGTGGRKDFKVKYDPKLKIEDDLSRRDFTINAMALRITTNQLPTNNQFIDPFKGLKDLQKKIIRTVDKPEQRFKEDYSRMLRGIRIACELNYKIETKTWIAIKKYIKHLNDRRKQDRVIPYEVVAKELLKTFRANPERAFDLFEESDLFKILMPEIKKMKNCPQPEQFHAEGDVFIHTKMALVSLSSKKFKKEFSDERPNINLIMATLFHDIGKPSTTQTPEKHGVDRIRTNNHDTVGSEMAEKIMTRLKLSSPANIGLNLKKVSWLIRNHMIMLQLKNTLQEVKPSTLEKYFFNQEMPSQDLLKLIFADISACQPKETWQPIFKDYFNLKRKLITLASLSKKKKSLPLPLLNGHEIMKILKIDSSPLIGKIKDGLRTAQLNKKVKDKKEARIFVQKNYARRS